MDWGFGVDGFFLRREPVFWRHCVSCYSYHCAGGWFNEALARPHALRSSLVTAETKMTGRVLMGSGQCVPPQQVLATAFLAVVGRFPVLSVISCEEDEPCGPVTAESPRREVSPRCRNEDAAERLRLCGVAGVIDAAQWTVRTTLGYQPWASRTLIIAARILFQVSGVSSTALGNMQPSQQMCWMPRAAASLSQ